MTITDISLNQLIHFHLNNTLNLRLLLHELYPQNGDRIVNIDYVTSFHPIYLAVVSSLRTCSTS